MPVKSRILTSEELNDVIARQTTNLILLTDPEQKIVYVNKAFQVHTGYSFSYCIGQKPDFLLGPQTDQKTVKRISKSLTKNSRAKETICNYTIEGKKYWVNVDISPIYDSEGELKNYLFIENDVTELVEARHNEHKIQTKLRALFDSSSNLNFVLDKNGKILESNKKGSDLVANILRDSVGLGTGLERYSVNLKGFQFTRKFKKAWLSGESTTFESKMLFPEQSGTWYEVSYNPVIGVNGTTEVMLMILTNIDRVKKSELHLLEQNGILNKIADTYAHDIRGPIATLLGLIHLVDEGMEPLENVYGLIKKTTNQLDTTVRSITNLSSQE